MTTIEHDGAASLTVEWLPARAHGNGSPGWFVVRTCACHAGVEITLPLPSREDAERTLAVLDADARKYGTP